jgi:single-stranded-DNA-specific exonuclease
MLDDGARIAFEYLMHYDIHGEDGIAEIVEWNQKRKDETTKQQNILDIAADAILTNKTRCMVLYAPGLHEGIIGINAARVVERYNMPAIVLTDSEDGNLKGSARSVEGINMKEALDAVAEFVYKYGGHAGAAGLTVEKDKLADFTKAINKVMPQAVVNTNTWQYDIEIDESEIVDILAEVRKYAPYGEAFPAPIVRINNYNLVKKYGKYYRYIKDTGVALNGMSSEATTFSLQEKFKNIGTPLNLNIVGTLSYSRFSKIPQIMVNDFQPVIKQQEVGFLL